MQSQIDLMTQNDSKLSNLEQTKKNFENLKSKHFNTIVQAFLFLVSLGTVRLLNVIVEVEVC